MASTITNEYAYQDDEGNQGNKNMPPPSPKASSSVKAYGIPPDHGLPCNIHLNGPVFNFERAIDNMKYTLENFCQKMGNLDKCCHRLFYGLCMLLDIQINGSNTNVNISKKSLFKAQEYGAIVPRLRKLTNYKDPKFNLASSELRTGMERSASLAAHSPAKIKPKKRVDEAEAAGDIVRFLICYMEWKGLDKDSLDDKFAVKSFLNKNSIVAQRVEAEWGDLNDDDDKSQHMQMLYAAVFNTHTHFFKGMRDSINDALNTKQAKSQAIMCGVATLKEPDEKASPFVDWLNNISNQIMADEEHAKNIVAEVSLTAREAHLKKFYDEISKDLKRKNFNIGQKYIVNDYVFSKAQDGVRECMYIARKEFTAMQKPEHDIVSGNWVIPRPEEENVEDYVSREIKKIETQTEQYINGKLFNTNLAKEFMGTLKGYPSKGYFDNVMIGGFFHGINMKNFKSRKKKIIEYVTEKMFDVESASFEYNVNIFFKNNGCVDIRNKFYNISREHLEYIYKETPHATDYKCVDCHKNTDQLESCKLCFPLHELYELYKSMKDQARKEAYKQKADYHDYLLYKEILEDPQKMIERATLISPREKAYKEKVLLDPDLGARKEYALYLYDFEETGNIKEMKLIDAHKDDYERTFHKIEIYENLKGVMMVEDDDNIAINIPTIRPIDAAKHRDLEYVCDLLENTSDKDRIEIRKHYSWATSVKMPILHNGLLYKNEYEHVFPVLFLFLFIGGYIHLPSMEGHKLWKKMFADWNLELSAKLSIANPTDKAKISHTLKRLSYSNLFPFNEYNYDLIEWMFKQSKNDMLDFIIDTISLFDESVLLCESDANQLKSDAVYIKCSITKPNERIWTPSNRSIVEYLIPIDRMIQSINYPIATNVYNVAKALGKRLKGGSSTLHQYSFTTENIGGLSISLINCAKPKTQSIHSNYNYHDIKSEAGTTGDVGYKIQFRFKKKETTETDSINEEGRRLTIEDFFNESNDRVGIVETMHENLLTEYDSKNDLNVFIEGRRFILIPGGDLSVSFSPTLKGTYKIDSVETMTQDDGKEYIDVYCNVLLPPGTRHSLNTTGGGKKKKSKGKKKRTKKKRRKKKKTRWRR